ncbi:MAG: M14 metallopeptidase family protein [Flavobacteriaceae bacterium]
MISEEIYFAIKEEKIIGRYVVNDQIISFMKRFESLYNVETIGYSVQKRPIMGITLGQGPTKILMWSQMHGNESTTTKAVLDLLNWFLSSTVASSAVLDNCTLKIIPILNPDGAEAYTRFNANYVDLNRDAQELSQPESKVLREVFEDFKPNFCFNLHDQRTIYNVGCSDKPATVSFLAPSLDAVRSISQNRGVAMQVIVAMNQVLQQMIPGQVGRYDDGYNANCVGDAFQMLKTPTILFEAGHFGHDYERESTRKFLFYALLTAVNSIADKSYEMYSKDGYFNIPENQKQFFDILVKNAHLINNTLSTDIGILYTEVLREGSIHFEPNIESAGNLEGYFGHEIFDCMNEKDLGSLKSSDYWKLLAP